MSTFKVGDRVRCSGDGDEGFITSEAGKGYRVDFELDGDILMFSEELELVERQPNRTYCEQDAVDPGHYKFPGGAEVIDITRHMDFLTGNAVKYLARAGRKGDRLTDLQKARKYIDWAIEDEESE